MTDIQLALAASRDRAPQAFDITYKQGGETKYRLVYATDEHTAQAFLFRSTWAPVVVLSCKHITARPRASAGDWSMT